MEIQSAFNLGVQGLQKANEDVYKSAENIASSASLAAESYGVAQATNAPVANVNELTKQKGDSPVKLTQSLIDLRVAEFQAKASVEILQSADENLGSLLDVTV
ncbi:hypothetical protein H4J46_09240 [Colwellia sp. MB02u-6]|uniref:hypothetical protein n=1 Tax=Colwellia sp. MB02u-6 TaxID=2759824 RepID=UPI0015F5B2EA|nr:hypothetical protein [Colwellia sp. MB02u-6]MBA6328117.1 hypothetical protein [Colwellia sp. MB02u-6]